MTRQVSSSASTACQAVENISIEDAPKIVRGADAAVTDCFARSTHEPLGVKFLPIVAPAAERVAPAERYDPVAGKVSAVGLVEKEDANIRQCVTRKALAGRCVVIGEGEKKMRRDPVGTGSALLKMAFGR